MKTKMWQSNLFQINVKSGSLMHNHKHNLMETLLINKILINQNVFKNKVQPKMTEKVFIAMGVV